MSSYPIDALVFDIVEAGKPVWRMSTRIHGAEGFKDIQHKFENASYTTVDIRKCRTHFGWLFAVDNLYRITP